MLFDKTTFGRVSIVRKLLPILLLLLSSPFVHAASIDIFDAARLGDLEAIDTYIKDGADIEIRNSDGYTPFILAAYYGNDQALEVLLENGADPCAVDNRGSNAFMGVAFRGHVNTAKWLLANTSCNVNHQNFVGQTALMMSSLFGQEEMIQVLLDNGADPKIEDLQGNTAASLAQSQGLTEAVQMFN